MKQQRRTCILGSYDFNLERALGAQKSLAKDGGFLENGSKWPLGELDFQSRASERKDALEFGNHTKEP